MSRGFCKHGVLYELDCDKCLNQYETERAKPMTRVSSPPNPQKILCTIIHETARAVLISVAGEKHWIPLSQITELHKVNEGLGEGTYVKMKEWIAKEKGFI